jgi:PD-(D/E)XK nuclease superfamily protein
MISKNSDGLPLYHFDRSRLETAGDCERKYYWNYGFLGIGIVKVRELNPYWPFITGRFIHEGIEGIILGKSAKESADLAAKQYRDEYEPVVSNPDIQPDLMARLQFELNQEIDLVKVLVYGWSLVGYPRLLSNYQPVEGGVEQEEAIGWIIGDPGDQVEMRLLTRTDLLAKSKSSGMAMVVNFKSTSNPNEQWRQSFQVDMQTLTEAIAVESRLGMKVDGVIIEGLVKGSKNEWPKGSGFYQYNNMLIYAWVKDSTDVSLPGEQGGMEYESSYEYSCNSPHIMGNGAKCPGNKEHRLGKGFRKRAVRDCYPGGVYGWIDYLVRNDISTLESYFLSLPPITRDAYQVERWKRQTLITEKVRQDMAAYVDSYFLDNNKQGAFEALDYSFPMTTGWDCFNCTYHDICWGSSDPTDESKWKARVPNHPAELVNIEVKSAS